VVVERTGFVLIFGDFCTVVERVGFSLKIFEFDKVTEQKFCVSYVLMIHL
jgi:hypothetical protein